MARFLFTTWEGGGHVQPLLLVARDLAARGHDVLVVSDPCNAPDAQALAVPFRPWTTAPFQTGKTRDDDRLKDHEADNPLAVIQRLVDRVMSGPALAYARDTLAAIDAFAPDVVVSFSSLYQAQEPVLRAVIAALGDLPVRGVVTTGPTIDPVEFEAPGNVAVVRSAPHGALLKNAALFITHAGHGSTLRPLLASVPLLCLPMGRDQNDNAARVAQRGAGLTLAAGSSTDAIATAARRLLDEPSFKIAAETLGALIRADEALRDAAPVLEALAGVQQ